MRRLSTLILPLLLFIPLFMSCGKTPGGVLSQNEMADLIVDLQLAEAYIDSRSGDFQTDSSKQVIKQSIFKKHGITQKDYDSSMVWYAHNMEDYVKAYDKAVGKLKHKYDKLDNGKGNNNMPSDMMGMNEETPAAPTHEASPKSAVPRGVKGLRKLSRDAKGDTADLWQGKRSYMLTQGAQQGFITFDFPYDSNNKPGDRYQLAYKLYPGGNKFKVCLNVDYTDGSTSQMSRSTNSDGWVAIDLQSDTSRQVRRIYGYISYDVKRGHISYVDSLSLMRTRKNPKYYNSIHAQRLLERKK
jgi:hypothetical protein